ncbi:hypothetical protein PENTCL1PPCAC_12185, partial [Pristionchus entomophagus]
WILFHTMDITSCDDYNPEEDMIYLNCSIDQETMCWRLKDLHTAWAFGTSPMVIVIIVLSVIALFFNLIYTILIHIVWIREKFKGNKRTIIVANRSIFTIFTISLLYTTLILWQTSGFGYVPSSIFLTIAACDYMVVASNFFIVTILMYVAVMNPIFYSTRLQFRHYIMIGWGFSAISIIMGIIVGLGGSALFYPSESVFACPVETCQYPFAISIVSLIFVGYLLMMICYSLVILRLRKRIEKLALFSLRVSFLVITIFFVPTIAMLVVTMINFENFSSLGDSSKSPCSRLENGNVLLLCCYLVTSTAIFWLIGMTIDSIFNLVTEAKIYEHFSTFRRLKSIIERSKLTSV